MWLNEVLAAVILVVVLPSLAENPQKDECQHTTSCSSCILKSFCVWCVTKSKCTKQECGNDNVIYPNHVAAIMAGPSFCPRVVEPDVWTIKSGTRESIAVKITQIHLYMAFTPWKCKITVDDKETVISAMLLGDTVFCEASSFENNSENPYVNGTVSVLWDYSKNFDGAVPITVCRCELDPKCSACK